MKIMTSIRVVICVITPLCHATDLEFPQISSSDVDAIFDYSYLAHRSYADFLNSCDIPKEIRSSITVPPFYASQIVPELYFLWLRYFAALDYDNPKKRERVKAKFLHALELLKTNKQEGAIELWDNAWEDGNPEAYLKLQELFKEHKHWCQVLSHFPTSESEMMKKIKDAREALEFFYGNEEGYEKLNLETAHISVPFAHFEEARLINALKTKDIDLEKPIRHVLQGVHVHYRHQWTQAKISDTFDVSQSSVSSFLRGKPCPKLVENVRQHYEDNPSFYFFEPRKTGWSLSSFLPWSSSKPKKSLPDVKVPLITPSSEKKDD